jgi:3-methyladenine DNA glycosylase/8-oxoguanine DNA glycosylase
MSRTVTRALTVPADYDFGGTLGQLPMGRHDPCLRLVDGVFWWVARTPDGVGTLCLRRDGAGLLATGYGPGAQWLVEQADAVAGLRDDVAGFASLAPRHPVVAQLAHRFRGLRLPATGRVYQRLLRTILEQKVTGTEAYRAYAALVRYCHRTTGGEPAPGPTPAEWSVGPPDLLPPPDPAVVAATPYWVLHRFGVEQRRADTLARASVSADRLEACPSPDAAHRSLTAIAGIGPWTSAEVLRVAYGDPDAVSVGDWHIPHTVSWALASEARAGARSSPSGVGLSPADERMLELFEPFRGHRGRVCMLLEQAGYSAPRFGPRMPIRSFASF